MPELLVLNPVKRRRKSAKKARRAAPRRAANPARRVRRRVRRNPVSVAGVKSAVRRRMTRSGSKRRVTRRRRNPIGMKSLNMSSITKMLKGAMIGGAGAVGIDMLMSKLTPHLPVSMQPNATGDVGVFDAIKAGLTVVLGRALSKPTKGLSEQAAAGALAVQAYGVVQSLVAKYMPQAAAGAATVAGVGYATPNAIVRGNARISPIMRLNAFQRKGTPSPLLNAFQRKGTPSPLLNGASRVSAREGVRYT